MHSVIRLLSPGRTDPLADVRRLLVALVDTGELQGYRGIDTSYQGQPSNPEMMLRKTDEAGVYSLTQCFEIRLHLPEDNQLHLSLASGSLLRVELSQNYATVRAIDDVELRMEDTREQESLILYLDAIKLSQHSWVICANDRSMGNYKYSFCGDAGGERSELPRLARDTKAVKLSSALSFGPSVDQPPGT